MNIEWEILYTPRDFSTFVSQLDLTKPLALDTETYKQRPTQPSAYLLGLSISGYRESGQVCSAYLPLYHFEGTLGMFRGFYRSLQDPLIKDFLANNKFVGWNVPFDKTWIDAVFKIDSRWLADGRILWHAQNNDPTIRGFGLKLAQTKILEWSESNEKELEEQVQSRGGKLSRGDHYMANLEVLAKYACLDTYSTLKAYEILNQFVVKHDYQWFVEDLLEYALVLYKAGAQGIAVNESGLLLTSNQYSNRRGEAANRLREVCNVEIGAIEDAWKSKKLATLKTPSGRQRFLDRGGIKFNPSSGKQRALLLHTILEFPVRERTPTGQAKTDLSALAGIPHSAARELSSYSEFKKIAEATKTYLKHVVDGRLTTSYDVCGTVSGRLSGFAPSVLNMPFSEADVMKNFTVDPGYVGIHADLAAIEPCVLAHYTNDPGLLKVYKEGKGDIYLDLAVEALFKDRADLVAEYNPEIPVSSEVKEKFKDLRNICKTIHLAVSYTGTYITVAKNLTKNGFPTTQGQAMALVKGYWNKFKRVKAFERRILEVYKEKGFLRNLVGRIILVPNIYEKDLMNRLVQSSAHDILRLWVMQIIKNFNEAGVDWRYLLPDIHDSTTFMVKTGQEEKARLCYIEALKEVEKQVNIDVPLKCELKFCTTLAGLKNNE